MTEEERQLLREVADYCKRAGIRESQLTRRAIRAPQFCERIRNGSSCTFQVAQRLRDYMAAHPPESVR